MNQNSKGTRRSQKGLRVWTLVQARAALPYVMPVLRSLREHWVEMRSHRLRVRRLGKRPGRPDRTLMIALQDEQQELQNAAAAYAEAQRELHALGITCLDPVRGQALFPFKHEKKHSWFVFDLFDEQPLRDPRDQDDPNDTCRPLLTSEEDSAPAV